MSESEKPPECTCGYPQTIYRSPTGHAGACPVQRRHEDEAWADIRKRIVERRARRST